MKTTILLAGSKHLFIVLIAIFESILIGLSLIVTVGQLSNTQTDVQIQQKAPYIFTDYFQPDILLIQHGVPSGKDYQKNTGYGRNGYDGLDEKLISKTHLDNSSIDI